MNTFAWDWKRRFTHKQTTCEEQRIIVYPIRCAPISVLRTAGSDRPLRRQSATGDDPHSCDNFSGNRK